MVIVRNTLTAFSLLRLSRISLIQNIGLIEKPSIFDHPFNINRNNFVRNIPFLNRKYSSAKSIIRYDIVVIYKQWVRSFEVLSITANHNKSNQTFPLDLFLIQIKILIIIKLKFHSWPNKRRWLALLSQMTIKHLSTIQLIFQIEYFSRLQRVIFELVKVNCCYLILKIKITFFCLVKPSKNEDLVMNK